MTEEANVSAVPKKAEKKEEVTQSAKLGPPPVEKSVAETAPEKPKKEPYITRIKREKEEADAKILELEKQIADSKQAPTPEVREADDDRDQEIVVDIERDGKDDQGRIKYKKHKLPKEIAFKSLVSYYQGRKVKTIPQPDVDDQSRNYATVYVRLTKTDTSTGQKLSVIKDMPIWIAAERAIEGKLVELVSKKQYEEFYADRAARDKKWADNAFYNGLIQALQQDRQTTIAQPEPNLANKTNF